MNSRLLAVLSLALLACAEPADEPESPDPSALVAPKDGKGAPRRPAPRRSCDDLQEQARGLLGSYQRCTQDADCVVERVEAPCLVPFLCHVSIARDGERAQLAREAASLSLTYRRTCGEQCPIARCASPEDLHAYCDTETKRCTSTLRPREADASTPVELPPTLDAGT